MNFYSVEEERDSFGAAEGTILATQTQMSTNFAIIYQKNKQNPIVALNGRVTKYLNCRSVVTRECESWNASHCTVPEKPEIDLTQTDIPSGTELMVCLTINGQKKCKKTTFIEVEQKIFYEWLRIDGTLLYLSQPFIDGLLPNERRKLGFTDGKAGDVNTETHISNRIEIKMRTVKEFRERLGDAVVDAIAKQTRIEFGCPMEDDPPFKDVTNYRYDWTQSVTNTQTVITFTNSGMTRIHEFAEQNPDASSSDIGYSLYPTLAKDRYTRPSLIQRIQSLTGRPISDWKF